MLTDSTDGIAVETSARLLGIHEFSLFSHIQNGEIESIRARLGEVLLPKGEVERLVAASVVPSSVPDKAVEFTDDDLGVERRHGGLRRNGQSTAFRVPDYHGGFTEREIDG